MTNAGTLRDRELLVFDGACGTSLQGLDLPVSTWDGREGCNEWLNVTAPDVIRDIHAGFVAAGAQVLETNTFGASRIVLAEYGLEDRVAEINTAAVQAARAAAADNPDVFVAGSMGPTTKLVSLGHIELDPLEEAYTEQAAALLAAGVDALILETCQDLLQVKTAVRAALDAVEHAGRDVPLMVSVTIEQTGTLLVGSDIAAVCATLEPFPIFSLGLNCATGPEAMASQIRYLAHQWPGRISCMPNQGLPEVVAGRTVYPMSPQDFAARMLRYVEQEGLSIVGGCCGTTPAHIRDLVAALQGVHPAARDVVV